MGTFQRSVRLIGITPFFARQNNLKYYQTYQKSFFSPRSFTTQTTETNPSPLSHIAFQPKTRPEWFELQTLKVINVLPSVYQVELNRPTKSNSMNLTMWKEFKKSFEILSDEEDCKVIIITGAGKVFCGGIDVTLFTDFRKYQVDHGRNALWIFPQVQLFQEAFNLIEKCEKPVIASIHSLCIGAGVDLACACDIRYCSSQASFSIKEIDFAITADLGTLQRLPKITKNESLLRELALSARFFSAEEAKDFGFVSKVFPTNEELQKEVLLLANKIAKNTRTPVSEETKALLNYSREHSMNDTLHYSLARKSVLKHLDFYQVENISRSSEPMKSDSVETPVQQSLKVENISRSSEKKKKNTNV